jgi:hypothetical protein
MPTKYRELNWEGAGYFGVPLAEHEMTAAEAAKWAEFDAVLASAKRGDFSGVSTLLTIYDDTDSWMLGSACSDLIGDIGDRRFFEQLRPAVTNVLDPTYSVDLGRSLAIWGHLTVVPALLETLGRIADFVDAPALVQMISTLLEPEPGPLGEIAALKDVAGYSARVLQQLDLVAARVGTGDAIVLLGDLFSVDRLVAAMRQLLLSGGRFDPYLRHKFEATTGVDCSGFYENEILQPLQALATLEDFEDRVDPTEYAPGRRYFFGHPLPD